MNVVFSSGSAIVDPLPDGANSSSMQYLCMVCSKI